MTTENETHLNKDAFPKSTFLSFKDFEAKIDPRLQDYLKDWQLEEKYFGDDVFIPGHTDSKFEPIRYFKVIKGEKDAFGEHGHRDTEMCLTLFAHWPGFDHECEVNLFIRNTDVLDETVNKVSAEIIKTGGAPMTVKWRGKKVTDFKVQEWIFQRTVDKIWIDDMRNIK